jgi:uncharacterized protein YuzE
MDVEHFLGTDSLLTEFSDREFVETRDANENFMIELDADGKIVSLIVEHAGAHIDVSKLSFEKIPG